MGRNPARPDLVGRIIRSDEEIRQLRVRPNDSLVVNDLSPYLTTGFSAVEYFDSDGPFAGFYVDRGRCWLAGAVEYSDASHIEGGSLVGSNPLPVECRPVMSLTNVTFDFDQDMTGWSPAPFGDANDATMGARIQADVTRSGFINFESVVSNYQGRARKGTSTNFYTGVPDGSVLILEGISWLVDS